MCNFSWPFESIVRNLHNIFWLLTVMHTVMHMQQPPVAAAARCGSAQKASLTVNSLFDLLQFQMHEWITKVIVLLY